MNGIRHSLKNWLVRELMDDLQGTHPVSIPRGYLAGNDGAVISGHLCGFCDASTRAYAAVVYIALKTKSGVMVRFVTAKTRVAPLKKQMIPRPELLSALLLSHLITAVSNALESTLPTLELQCFTDSQVVFYWIRWTDKEWKPFIHNRVVEI